MLHQRLQHAAAKTLNYFKSQLQSNGSYGTDCSDIAYYFKAPMLFILAGYPEQANLLLDYIKEKFMTPTGDFKSAATVKSIKPEYGEYWSYANGWIVRAAQQINRPDISKPGYNYLLQSYAAVNKGFLSNNPQSQNGITDVLMTAHFGLINLERGNWQLAKAAGDYLCTALCKQSDLAAGFYLRFDAANVPLTTFGPENAALYFVSKTQPNQLYFMIGYPSAYLARLYQATHDERYLTAAQAYLDFALSCHENVWASNFSHKIAWAAAALFEITHEEKYAQALARIADHFLTLQHDNGLWLQEVDRITAYDQSAEIAGWLLVIANYLKPFMEKASFTDEKLASLL